MASMLNNVSNYFYNSLDTLKQVKKPTQKEIVSLTIAIFTIVIIAGLYFVAVDGVVVTFYNQFYNLMK